MTEPATAQRRRSWPLTALAILAATVHAVRAALGGLKGGAKPPMAGPAELATAIRSADYLAQDSRWPDPR